MSVIMRLRNAEIRKRTLKGTWQAHTAAECWARLPGSDSPIQSQGASLYPRWGDSSLKGKQACLQSWEHHGPYDTPPNLLMPCQQLP